MWDGVPWFMGYGAIHGPEIARVLAYAAVGGGEGVIGTTDCQVIQSAIPDGNIHITQGAVAVLNRFPGGGQQAYLVRNEGDEVLALAPQGSSGVRYDLVAVIVEDPDYAGQPVPADPATGPYVRTTVYSDVPADTVYLAEVDPDASGYALARVKFDASDGTVNQADITDLRELAQPRSKTVLRNYEVPNDGSSGTVSPNSVYAPFPANAVWNDIDIPAWATRAIVRGIWSNVIIESTPGQGATILQGLGAQRIKLGTLYTERGEWHFRLTSGEEITGVAFNSDDISIPVPLRGTRQSAQMEMYQVGDGTGNIVDLNWAYMTSVILEITFFEAPESN